MSAAPCRITLVDNPAPQDWRMVVGIVDDDGTLSPWAVVASLPFAPKIVLPTIRYFTDHVNLRTEDSYGFAATFNPTHHETSANEYGWVSPWNFGLNQALSCS